MSNKNNIINVMSKKKDLIISKNLSRGFMTAPKLNNFQLKLFYLSLQKLVYLNWNNDLKTVKLNEDLISELIFNRSEVFKTLNITSKKLYSDLKKNKDQIHKIGISFMDDNNKTLESMIIIPYFNLSPNHLKISFTPQCIKYLLPYKNYDENDFYFMLGDGFIYTKLLFSKLRSYQLPNFNKKIELSFIEIQELFNINKESNYSKWDHFNQNIWKRVEKELKETIEFKNLKITKIIGETLNGKHSKITGIKFIIPMYLKNKTNIKNNSESISENDWEL